MDNVKRFIDNGGQVKICPEYKKGMKLRPLPKKRVWHAPPDGHDVEVCASCANKGRCEDPCNPLKWINGDKPLKEKYLNEPIDAYEIPDYNLILYDLAQSTNPPDRIGEIIKIQDLRRRAICSMLAVKIPRQNIAALLSITRQHLHKLLQPMLHQKGNKSP
jgi:hypothetical protein